MDAGAARATTWNKPRWDQGRPRREHIDLGLALLSMVRKPDVPLSRDDIAAWCECSPQAIHHIEQRALAKMRVKLSEIEARTKAAISQGVFTDVLINLKSSASTAIGETAPSIIVPENSTRSSL